MSIVEKETLIRRALERHKTEERFRPISVLNVIESLPTMTAFIGCEIARKKLLVLLTYISQIYQAERLEIILEGIGNIIFPMSLF